MTLTGHVEEQTSSRAALELIIQERQLDAHFQPIVDLVTATPVGYEVLTRPRTLGMNAEQLFGSAKRHHLTWELERACRINAFDTIARLPESARSHNFFLNVSPDILRDPRFIEGFTRANLEEVGVDLDQIVIEITEHDTVEDYEEFEQLVRHYERQGFRLALDDFGSGHSSLITLINAVPHYLKLDREVVRNVHLEPYKQRLVRSLVGFAASVETRLIAEGVERWDELDVLARLGVRYAQGYLIARPAPEPPQLSASLGATLRQVVRAFDRRQSEVDDTVGHLVIRTQTVSSRTMCCGELDQLFRRHPDTDHVVVLEGQEPAALITRQHFYSKTSGPVGHALFARKPLEKVSKGYLTVSESSRVTTLAKLAMERPRDDLYDPVVVTDDVGYFLGTVTMKQVIARSVEIEIQSAADANPLTKLPGNPSIEKWLQEALESGDYTVIYADLDRLKEFNDAYGFVVGDDLIQLAARVLERGFEPLGHAARLGHVGSDDFVLVARCPVTPQLLNDIVKEFDSLKRDLFEPEDLARGAFSARDRRGTKVEIPLTTLSLVAVDSERIGGDVHPALLAQVAATLKKRVKQMTLSKRKSCFIFERRRYSVPPSSRAPS